MSRCQGAKAEAVNLVAAAERVAADKVEEMAAVKVGVMAEEMAVVLVAARVVVTAAAARGG